MTGTEGVCLAVWLDLEKVTHSYRDRNMTPLDPRLCHPRVGVSEHVAQLSGVMFGIFEKFKFGDY